MRDRKKNLFFSSSPYISHPLLISQLYVYLLFAYDVYNTALLDADPAKEHALGAQRANKPHINLTLKKKIKIKKDLNISSYR
jgi:hypothetical protein